MPPRNSTPEPALPPRQSWSASLTPRRARRQGDEESPLYPPPQDSAPWNLHEQRMHQHRQQEQFLYDERMRSSGPSSRPAPLDLDLPGSGFGASSPGQFDGGTTQALSAEDGGQGREQPGAPSLGRVGRYVLTLRMGAGGIGTVWAAHDPILSRVVAIKTLPHRPGSDARSRPAQDFLDEARAAARLSHPNIVTVYDAGVSDEGSYIVMELLRGKDLSQLLKAGWRPSPQHAASIIQRVAEAIDYAHGQGVIHRDLKPANIFMVDRSRPVVLDFGIAHSGTHDGPSANVLCSPFYAAPEQLAGDHGDRRTDVYALGVVLYELLTGERPYTGRTLDEVTTAVNTARPYPIQRLRSGVSASLVGIAMRAMARDPDQRFRSAGALARALETWLQERGVYATSSRGTPSITEGQNAWVRKRQRRLYALAAVLGATGVLLAVLAGVPQDSGAGSQSQLQLPTVATVIEGASR
jgi:hypothetical protein